MYFGAVFQIFALVYLNELSSSFFVIFVMECSADVVCPASFPRSTETPYVLGWLVRPTGNSFHPTALRNENHFEVRFLSPAYFIVIRLHILFLFGKCRARFPL